MIVRDQTIRVVDARPSQGGLSCSFCGRRGGPDRHIVAGPGVAICDDCVGLCVESLATTTSDAFRIVVGQKGSIQVTDYKDESHASTTHSGGSLVRYCARCHAWNFGSSSDACLQCGAPFEGTNSDPR